MKDHQVTRDGKTLFIGDKGECFIWLLNHQPNSTDHALKYEGYKIEPLTGEEI